MLTIRMLTLRAPELLVTYTVREYSFVASLKKYEEDIYLFILGFRVDSKTLNTNHSQSACVMGALRRPA